MDLVDEEDVALAEIGEDPHEVRAALDGGAGGGDEAGAHLVGEDPRQRGLAQSRGPIEQDVIDALAALARRLHRHLETRHRLLLSDVLGEGVGSQLALEGRLLRCCRAAEWLGPRRSGAHAGALEAAAGDAR